MYLNAIARQVKSGKISLPELDLANDAEYTYVWALVDSGAGANVARKGQFPNSVQVDAPRITLSAANGELMPNQGARKVMALNRDGTQTARVFYEADVEMPILAVTELTQEGDQGSEVRFRKKDGFIEDNLTGHREHFVKRKGVYFVKVFVPKASSDFIRPGA